MTYRTLSESDHRNQVRTTITTIWKEEKVWDVSINSPTCSLLFCSLFFVKECLLDIIYLVFSKFSNFLTCPYTSVVVMGNGSSRFTLYLCTIPYRGRPISTFLLPVF